MRSPSLQPAFVAVATLMLFAPGPPHSFGCVSSRAETPRSGRVQRSQIEQGLRFYLANPWRCVCLLVVCVCVCVYCFLGDM